MIGQRIKQARVAAGMTQDQVIAALVAERISLTKGGLSKYERGGSTPKSTVMRGLAEVLGVEASFFLEEPLIQIRWLAFRKGSRMGKTRQERVKAMAESQLEAFLTLKNALVPTSDDDLPGPMSVSRAEHAEEAADSLRRSWRLGEQPIESVTAAIEDGGGVVVETGGSEDMFDGLSGWANETVPVIVVSRAGEDDRRRFNLAHELGHLFMDVRAEDKKAEEKLANRFAAAFLVTATTARRELGIKRRHLDLRELMMLKQKHGLSMQAWIYRAADLGIIEQAHARSLFAEMGSRGWRRHEPVEFKGEERPKKLRLLTVRALAEGLLSHRQAERICPGMTREVGEMEGEPAEVLNARSLSRMPKDARDRLMEQAATTVAEEYDTDGGLSGLEALSEEDHRDDPLDD